MMKRLAGLFKKDTKIAYRNFFFGIVVLSAALLIVVTNFFIPEKINTDAKIIYYYEGGNEQSLVPLLKFLENKAGNLRVDSKEEIAQKMEKDRNTIGMVIKQVNNSPSIEFVMQGYESEKTKRALEISMKAVLDAGKAGSTNIKTVVLKDAAGDMDIPFNLWIIPVMILSEPVMLGFILIAVLAFMEKEEGTTKSYLVSPGRVPEYLGSKIILMVILGLMSTFLITSFTVGFNVNWPMLLLIVTVGSIFGSTLGLLIASFFNSLSKSMVWLVIISMILSLTQVSYFMPSFAPLYLTIVPTYGMLFALKEAIFPSGNPGIIYQTLFTTGITSIVLYLLCIVSYKRTLVKD